MNKDPPDFNGLTLLEVFADAGFPAWFEDGVLRPAPDLHPSDPAPSRTLLAMRARLENLRTPLVDYEPVEGDDGLQPRPAGMPPPMSPGQRRLWFISRIYPASSAYNTNILFRLVGEIDIAALRFACMVLVARHESLRTVFPDEGGDPVPRITNAFDPLRVDDMTGTGRDEFERDSQLRLEAAARAPFDLSNGPLIQVLLVCGPDDQNVLEINVHHLVTDGWSMALIGYEIAALYNCYHAGRVPELPTVRIQYGDYSAWQETRLAGDAFDRQVAYWCARLGDAPRQLELATDYPRVARSGWQGAGLIDVLENETVERLRLLCRAERVTLLMVMLAVFALLLSRFSRQDDLCIGSPVGNRPGERAAGTVGFFANTLVHRVRIDARESFVDLLRRVRDDTLDAFRHPDVPFEHLVSKLNPPRSPGINPLFQALLVHHDKTLARLDLEGVETRALPEIVAGAKFDLSLWVVETSDGIETHWEYPTALFCAQTVKNMAAQCSMLLAAACAKPETPVRRLPTITDEERRRLVAWNDTASDKPTPDAATVLFHAQCRERPDAVAIDHNGREIDYATLDREARALAAAVRARADTGPVGLCLQRGPQLVAALLGILDGGASCVPLEAGHPAPRIRDIADDAGIGLVIADATTRAPFDDAGIPVLTPEPLASAESAGSPPAGAAADIAYVLYTSGSTGRPKGVAMPRDALCNLLAWQASLPDLGKPARTLQFTSIAFDVALQEILGTLSTGGTLVLVSEETRRRPDRLIETIEARRVQRLFMPFSALQSLCEVARHRDDLCVEDVVTAGERLHLTSAVRDFLANTRARLHNHYGPTETHVVTAYTLPADPGAWPEYPPIGRPIRNTRIHLLGEANRLQPIGAPGEICIAGAGVARGYHRHPELDAGRFVDLRLHGVVQRVYRSGDLGRWRADGMLEFLGRVDDQVKLRGFRIEPGEVEAKLMEHPTVAAAAVTVRGGDARRHLAAFVTRSNEAATAAIDTADDALAAELDFWLRARLPDYMVPTVITVLDRLPATTSGKLDRGALPESEPTAAGREARVAPRDELERELASIWREVLDIDVEIGVDEDFFDLGGHSLLLGELLHRLETRFGSDLVFAELLEVTTVAALAARIRGGTGRPGTPDKHDHAPLSPEHYRLMLSHTLNCRGARARPGSLVVQYHGGAAGAPLIWCMPMNGGEADKLAELSGADQPLLVLHSGWNAITGDEAHGRALAEYYAREIDALVPEPAHIRLGGFCAGGSLACRLVEALAARGRGVACLWVVEKPYPLDLDYDGPLALIHGRDWHLNPYRYLGDLDAADAHEGVAAADPLAVLQRRHRGPVSLSLYPGDHEAFMAPWNAEFMDRFRESLAHMTSAARAPVDAGIEKARASAPARFEIAVASFTADVCKLEAGRQFMVEVVVSSEDAPPATAFVVHTRWFDRWGAPVSWASTATAGRWPNAASVTHVPVELRVPHDSGLYSVEFALDDGLGPTWVRRDPSWTGKERAYAVEVTSSPRLVDVSWHRALAARCIERGAYLSAGSHLAVLERNDAADLPASFACHCRLGRYRTAARVLREHGDAARASDDPMIPVHEARMHAALKQHDQAVACFLRAAPAFPDSGWLLRETASSQAAAGDADAALATLERITAVLRQPYLFDVIASIEIHHELGRRQAAQSMLERLSEAEPGNPLVSLTRGRILESEGNTESAIAEYRLCLERDPGELTAATRLAKLLRGRDEERGAIAVLESVAEHAEPRSPALYGLAMARLRAGMFDIAIADLEAAVAQFPPYQPAFRALAQHALRIGDVRGAAARLRRAGRFVTDPLSWHLAWARCLTQARKSEDVLYHYERALQLNPDLPRVRLDAGRLELQRGRVSAAAEHFTHVARRGPKAMRATAHARLAECRMRESRAEDALGIADTGLEIEADRGELHLARARALLQLGRHQEAIASCHRCRQLMPRSPHVPFLLGQIHLALGEFAEAAREMRAAVAAGHPESDRIRAALAAYGAPSPASGDDG